MIRSGFPGKNLRLIPAVLWLLLGPVPLSSLEWPDAVRLGMTELKGTGLNPENQYLAHRLSLEILDILTRCRDHRFGFDEREAYIAEQRNLEREATLASLGTLRAGRDLFLFSQDLTARKREETEQKIRDLEIRLSEGEGSGFSGPAPETLPLTLAAANLRGELLPSPPGSPARSGVRDLDLMVWGTLEESEGLILLDCRVYSFWEEKTIFRFRRAVLQENAGDLAAALEPLLRDSLLGRPWADMTAVLADRVEGSIVLDGRTGGGSRLEAFSLSPGIHRLQVSAEGYEPWIGTVQLEAGVHRQVEIRLTPLPASRIAVRSLPAGADLYLDSRWAGTTPLFIDSPPRLTRILIRREGYSDYTGFLRPGQEESLEAGLILPREEPGSYLKTRRDRFYDSLGRFVLSIPVTMVLYSAASTYSYAYEQETSLYGSTSEAQRLYSLGNLSYYGYLGGLSLNGVLLVNVILDAVSYVKAAGRDFKESRS